MRIISFIHTSALFCFILGALPSGAQQPADPAGAATGESASTEAASPATTVSAHSRIRIVRLSEVNGEVLLDRNSGKGFETPMTNLPIVEGDKLKTSNGVAEIEFEDNSTVRVAQNSLVEFPKLELLPGGAKASAILVRQGMVYVNLLNTKGNEFAVTFGKETVNLPPDSHVRLQLTATQADLAVLHGDALVTEPAGITTVGKNKTMTFDLANDTQPQIAKNVTEMPLDSWDHNAVQYHKNFANATSFGNSPYSYGINDMNYYGSFINASGCGGGGSMWRPYFTSASWDPYGSGAWAYYPSAGYSWVSPYPWGWTPFHYGSWAYCQGIGWGWRPGGEWMGLANNSFVTGNSLIASSNTFSHPRPPMHPPVSAQSSLVPVNLKAIPVSSLSDKNTFVFRGNSAGFGVPRGSMGKLNSFSGQAANHGAATTGVYYGGAASHGGEGGRASSGGSMSNAASSSAGMSSHAASSSMQGPAGGAMSHASAGASGGGGGGRR